MTADLDALSRRFSFGAQEFTASPLYQKLCTVIAGDPDLLAIAAACRPGQQPTNLYLAAVHFLLLGGASHDLAEFYPSIAGEQARSPEDVEPFFRDFCRTYREELVEIVSQRLVQTNVVKRSAALRLGLAIVAARHDGPVTLLEVGCSAGVHLCFDRYAYDIAGRTWGGPGAEVRIASEWRGAGRPPDLDHMPPIAHRLGIDLNPIDATDATERRWLRALIWPENDHEATLLDLALAVVAADPPPMIAGDALEVCPRLAGELPSDQAVVVFHAATRAHVPQPLRPRFDAVIAGLGRDRPLYGLSLEGPLYPDPRLDGLGATHVLGLRQITGEQRTTEHLAVVDGHAEWLMPLDL